MALDEDEIRKRSDAQQGEKICRICGGAVFEGTESDGQITYPVLLHRDHGFVDHHARIEGVN